MPGIYWEYPCWTILYFISQTIEVLCDSYILLSSIIHSNPWVCLDILQSVACGSNDIIAAPGGFCEHRISYVVTEGLHSSTGGKKLVIQYAKLHLPDHPGDGFAHF